MATKISLNSYFLPKLGIQLFIPNLILFMISEHDAYGVQELDLAFSSDEESDDDDGDEDIHFHIDESIPVQGICHTL